MARPESVALGGFYAAPEELIPSIAALVRLRVEHGREHAIVDPCAGEAAALVGLARCWLNLREDDYRLYACELEATRADAAQKRLWQEAASAKIDLAKGDAFQLQWGERYGRGAGATVAWLNPPYDLDPEHGRLEERWLRRFAPAIAVGGALLFFVPFYALTASAATLATHFEELSCWRVPAPHFDAFKQVVLVARRRPALLAPDRAVDAQVRAWGADAGALPELPAAGPAVLEVAPLDGAGFGRWEIAPLDVRGLLAQLRPWHATDRGGRLAPIPGVLPVEPFDQLLAPTFPLACPPKPAHIAAGIASGALSGARLDPDDATTGLPPLLVKGTFRKRFQTVDHRTNKDGDVTAEIQVQHPELEITALDLRRGRYHRLAADVSVTGARDVAGMTAGDLLASYGRSLLATLRERCPALYDPARDAGSVQLPALPRKLYTAQEHATRAVCQLLDGPDKAAILLGEVGSGKTSCALATAAARGARRVLVMCPPHLQKTWADQAAAVVPWARTVVLEDVAAVEAFAADQRDGMAIGILSREAAKLGHAWTGIAGRCPRCGAAIETPAEENARRRLRCEHSELVADGRTARAAERLAALLAPVFPDQAEVRQLIRGRVAQRFLDALAKRREAGAEPWPAVQPKIAPLARRVGTWIMGEEREPQRAVVDILAHLLLAADDEATTVKVARGVYLASLKDARAYGWGSRARQVARELMLLLPPRGEAQRALEEELRGHAVEDAPYTSSGWERWGRHVDAMAAGRDGEWDWRAYRFQGGRVCIEKLAAGSAEAAHTALAKLTAHGRWVESRPCGEPLFQAIPEPRRVPLAHYIARRHAGLFDLIVVDECFVAGTIVSGRPIESIRPGDTVLAFDEKTGTFSHRAVVRLFRKSPAALVRVRVRGCAATVCTPNHPFLTRRGWVPAGHLTMADEVLIAEGVCKVSGDGHRPDEVLEALPLQDVHGCGLRANRRRPDWAMHYLRPDRDDLRASRVQGSTDGAALLQQGMRKGVLAEASVGDGACDRDAGQGADRRAHEVPQSDARPRHQGQGAPEPQGDRTRSASPRGQREWAHGTAKATRGGPRMADGARRADEEAARDGLADELQARHREPDAAHRDRGGWGKSHGERAEGTGPQEGHVSTWAWVDGVEVLEPGRDGTFGGVCPDGLVYNLEVEGLHTYTANGVVVHNCHEAGCQDSAQSLAAQQLFQLRRPTIALTGSVMNGYASSLFILLWSLSSAFRAELGREEQGEFVRRYGYLKQVVELRERDSKKPVSFGAMTDRVERVERTSGQAPGVLPALLLRHLLPIAVTLHVDDLGIDLPPAEEIVDHVEPGAELGRRYQALQRTLLQQIKRDRFSQLSGRLFGQLAELPSYLDRASEDVGNAEGGVYQVRYPEAVGGAVVAAQPGLPAGELLPKEAWLVDVVRRELAGGRNVMVFCWHLELMPRLARLLEEATGEKAPILWADKVAPKKRETWIDKEIVGKGRRILIVNPVAVQTGLNNLVHFATVVWYENPACNPLIRRQAIGRVRRIGQRLQARVYAPVYKGTLQEVLHRLLLHKVGVSEAADGLDATAALQAAGVGAADELAGRDLGRLLYEMLIRGDGEEAPPERPGPTARRGSEPRQLGLGW